jgi:hypothetical protein
MSKKDKMKKPAYDSSLTYGEAGDITRVLRDLLLSTFSGEKTSLSDETRLGVLFLSMMDTLSKKKQLLDTLEEKAKVIPTYESKYAMSLKSYHKMLIETIMLAKSLSGEAQDIISPAEIDYDTLIVGDRVLLK